MIAGGKVERQANQRKPLALGVGDQYRLPGEGGLRCGGG
jgi:hypothetical protein